MDYLLPNRTQLHQYLNHKGWAARAAGQIGTLWTKDDSEIGVLHQYDSQNMHAAMRNLASRERRQPSAVAESVRYLYMDVTWVKVISPGYAAQLPQLAVMAKALSTAFRVYLAAAAATIERKPTFSNIPTRAKALARTIQVDYPRRNTYEVPILIPMPGESSQPMIDGIDPEAYPPFARQANLTLKESLRALNRHVIESASEPTDDMLDDLVEVGLSAELCSAVSGSFDEDVEALVASMEWSPATMPREMLPEQIILPREAADLIKRTGERIKRRNVTRESRFTGMVVALERRPEEDEGLITILTHVDGRERKLEVRLARGDYQEAVSCHREGASVTVEGQVEPRGRRGLKVTSLVSFGRTFH